MNLWAPGFKLYSLFLNVNFKGQYHFWGGHFVCRCQYSLGPSSAVAKKRKKSASEGNWEAVWGGERVAPPFLLPQVTPRLASFSDIFPIWPRFLPFSPTAEPDPRLMTVTLWNYLWMTKSKLRVSNTSYQSLQTTKLNFENLLGQQVFQNHNKNLFQSSSSLSKILKYSWRLIFLRKLLICNFIFLLLLLFLSIYCIYIFIFLYIL